ncbi:MAG: hypothetical protein HYT69_02885 [Candidatus Zambryskibacteria bacterium]|nr:hypothetical protein [Candidatus Zambryskibacteria bacterium]
MKQKIFLVAIAFSVIATPALAQDIRDKRVPTPVPAEKVRQASTTERRIEMQQGLSKRKAEHTAKVMTATIERLGNILARIESRIEKIRAAGGNTAESEGFVAEAKMHLSQAKDAVAAFASVNLLADKAKENFSTVRRAAEEVKVHIRAIHTALKNAVSSLKREN